MNFAIKYYRHCPILDKADEIIIKYFEKDEEIINFIQTFKDNQRIVLNITDLPDPIASLEIFKAAARTHSISLLCSKDHPYHEYAEANIPFFFIEGASTIDEYVSQRDLGVSDIYVKNELCFSLERLTKNKQHLNIRVIPNFAQSSSDLYNYKIKKFFIRPEDLELYDNIINIIEFEGPLITQPTLYKIYHNDGRWLGNLNNLILGLNMDIDSTTIVPHFGQIRLNCNKRCAFGQCQTCDIIVHTAEILEEKGIAITKEKRIYEPEVNETIMSDESRPAITDNDKIS